MMYLSFTCITTVLFIVLQAVLQGLGKMGLPIRNLAIGGAIKLILNITLISKPSPYLWSHTCHIHSGNDNRCAQLCFGKKIYSIYVLDKKM